MSAPVSPSQPSIAIIVERAIRAYCRKSPGFPDMSLTAMAQDIVDALSVAQAETKPAAWTNQAQLGFLKDPACAQIPMAMWADKSASADVPLYAAPPPADLAYSAGNCGIAVEREDLADMLDSWADAANYKGEYLREKHGDVGEIAKYRAKYLAVSSTQGK